MLTARQLKIIKLIMNNPGIHGKEISENLNVSTRTIRSEITFMNDVTNCILIRYINTFEYQTRIYDQ